MRATKKQRTMTANNDGEAPSQPPSQHDTIDHKSARHSLLERLKLNGSSITEDYPDVSKRRAAVLVGLFFVKDDLFVLLTRRSSKLRSHAGEVCLPGGKNDDGESNTQTALREANEEVGLSESHILEVFGTLPPRLSAHLLSVTPVVSLIKQPVLQDQETGGVDKVTFMPTINPHEVESVFVVPLHFFHAPPTSARYQYYDYTFHTHTVRIHEFYYNKYRIWGLTAHILVEVAARIYGSSSVVVLDPPNLPRHIDLRVAENYDNDENSTVVAVYINNH